MVNPRAASSLARAAIAFWVACSTGQAMAVRTKARLKSRCVVKSTVSGVVAAIASACSLTIVASLRQVGRLGPATAGVWSKNLSSIF